MHVFRVLTPVLPHRTAGSSITHINILYKPLVSHSLARPLSTFVTIILSVPLRHCRGMRCMGVEMEQHKFNSCLRLVHKHTQKLTANLKGCKRISQKQTLLHLACLTRSGGAPSSHSGVDVCVSV